MWIQQKSEPTYDRPGHDLWLAELFIYAGHVCERTRCLLDRQQYDHLYATISSCQPGYKPNNVRRCHQLQKNSNRAKIMATVAQIWRYPSSRMGAKPYVCTASAGKTLPWDRHWAIARENSAADGSVWVPCQNFSRGAKAPLLMAINSNWDGICGKSSAPSRFTRSAVQPDDVGDQKRFLEWSAPMPENRAKSRAFDPRRECGLTDTDYPSISIGNLSSHRAVSQKLGRDLSVLLWRTNIWLDGLALGKNLMDRPHC